MIDGWVRCLREEIVYDCNKDFIYGIDVLVLMLIGVLNW